MSRSRRSPRAGLLRAVLALAALAAGACRDTSEITAPKSDTVTLERAGGAPADIWTADAHILVVSNVSLNLLPSTPPFASAFWSNRSSLPEDLSTYSVIIQSNKTTPLTAEEQVRLADFVKRGGGLYMSGEGPCCEPVNQAIAGVLALALDEGSSVRVGGYGTLERCFICFPVEYTVDPNAPQEIRWNPNFLSDEWHPTEPGLMSVPRFDQVLMWGEDIDRRGPVGAVWDAPATLTNYGRVVVMMDADWLSETGRPDTWDLLQNIVSFLAHGPQPPRVFLTGPTSGTEDGSYMFSAAGSYDGDGGDLEFEWTTSGGATINRNGSSTLAYFPDDGEFTVRVRVTDDERLSSVATLTVTVANGKPTMSFSAPTTVPEGSAISLSAVGKKDAPGDLPTLQVSYSCDGGATFGTTASCPAVDGPATVHVVGRVTDKDGEYTDYSRTVTVTNAAPAIASLGLPDTPVAVGTAVSLSATFTDGWVNDGHTATIDWDDATSSSGTVSGSTNPRSVSATHTYTVPGVYTVTLALSDDEPGASDAATHQYVVVYDPSAGFVTGGGWIAYGANACAALCGGAAGRGDFGFVSKYQKGATVPTGETRFEFHAGALKFESTTYEWLVVAGSRAQYKGRGTIGGAGDYGFLVTAVDGTTDAFRIKIWDRATGTAVFDNQAGADDDSPAATLLDKTNGNGSIVIRAK